MLCHRKPNPDIAFPRKPRQLRSGRIGLDCRLVIVVILPVLGGILWFFFGRTRPAPGSRWGRRRRPVAPDDDPRFLKQLDEDAWRRRMRERRGET